MTEASGQDKCSSTKEIKSGSIKGIQARSPDVCAWLGIPYAAPPVGEQRWRRPVQPKPWDGVLEANKYGAQCVQKGIIDAGPGSRPRGSEDCLYLNAWAPKKSGSFPVMVWIHGGGLMVGNGSGKIIQGDVLASRHDVVVVTFNYRLGVFGFLAHPDFRKEDQERSVGGYGMMDQIAALEWVRDNIAAFGGDPNNITIFGESSGGWSVCSLVASPRARGLFHRAIQESGACNMTRTIEQGYAFAKSLAQDVGCGTAAGATCLRSKSIEEIMRAAPWEASGLGMPFKPHEDGYLLKKMPIDHIRNGDYNRVPFLAGSNRDEYKLLVLLDPSLPGIGEREYRKKVEKEMGGWAKTFLAAYPAAAFPSPYDAFITMQADRGPGCGSHDPINAMSRHQDDVYYYRFDFDDIPHSNKVGSFHALEVPFVFGTLTRPPVSKLLGEKSLALAAPLSGVMMVYWTNFARTGNPNGPDLPPWPAYDPTGKKKIILDYPTLTVVHEPPEQSARCGLWDRYVRAEERKKQ